MTVAVYADWEGLTEPLRLGLLYARRSAGREVFEFEFEPSSLRHPSLSSLLLDPRIGLYEGRQHPAQGNKTFGVFADASPDRWGRLLMNRRLERDQRAGLVEASTRLYELDYLLGVHDAFRVGALRFRKLDSTGHEIGNFLDDRQGNAAPPFIQLRELEAASLSLERDEDNTAAAGNDWLRMLIAPGGSLGGARPKASIVDPEGHLWIAKFPSVRDHYDSGAWEMVIHTLARGCGLRVPQSLARRFASPHHTFLVKRFDRTSDDKRLHFASAMTLTNHQDGDDASTGASYLEIARVLINHGAQTDNDLNELWARIVFNMLVSNTDDHLRNHGFLLVPGKGWRLSEAYDMNPTADAYGLKLNISEADNALDLELARTAAPYFRVSAKKAEEIIELSKHVVKQWRLIAERLGIPTREQREMASAFRLVN
ncbi:MAG: HipA domain-containing protein [Pseudomonadota bacterium]